MSLLRGDPEQATKLAEESLTLSREVNDAECIGDSLLLLGHASNRRGDYEQARAFYEEGVSLSKEWGSASLLSVFLTDLGWIYLNEGQVEQATALFEEAAAMTRGQRGEELLVPLISLGWAALLGGDLARAKALHEANLALCRELGDKGLLASYCLEGLACVAGAEERAERAARLFGAAEALREAIGVPIAPDRHALMEPYVVAARSRMAEVTWQAAFTDGQAMSFDETVEYALSQEELTAAAPDAEERLPTHAPSDALTRREGEIAALVAQGLTNRRIAAELSVSEHTAATHIRRILRKLGLRSRTELAAWVSDQRPFSSNSG